MLLVQNDHVIEKLATSAANPSLGNPILPWASEGGSPRLGSNILDRVGDLFREY